MSFFFQAEDGIRDRTVTGVQTCALPISPTVTVEPPSPPPGSSTAYGRPATVTCTVTAVPSGSQTLTRSFRSMTMHGWSEIGRASCRERAWIHVVAAYRKKRETRHVLTRD